MLSEKELTPTNTRQCELLYLKQVNKDEATKGNRGVMDRAKEACS